MFWIIRPQLPCWKKFTRHILAILRQPRSCLRLAFFQELYRQDLLDTTFYANDGFLTGKHPMPEDTAVRDAIFSLEDEVERDAANRLKTNQRDTDALYARGWARSLRSSYVAMVERSFSTAFHMALQAHSDEARVLQIDPDYIDAKLVVGTYQYVIGALPFAFKIFFGFAGHHRLQGKGHGITERCLGPRPNGFHRIRNRDRALPPPRVEIIRSHHRRAQNSRPSIPHDFLFCLEEANLRKDAGEGMAAVDAYEKLLHEKPGYFPSAHLELAYFGLGEGLRGQHHYAEAAQAYEQAAGTQNAGAELKRRSFVAAGKCRDLSSERALAIRDYQAAMANGSDTTQGDIARKLINAPYRQP